MKDLRDTLKEVAYSILPITIVGIIIMMALRL